MPNETAAQQGRRVVLALTVEDRDLESVRQSVRAASSALECVEASSTDEALDIASIRKPMAFVCDWNCADQEKLMVFFQKLRATPAGASIALVMLLPEPPEASTMAVCGEYSVRNVIFSENAVEALKPILTEILAEASKPSAMRSFLNRIDQAHASGAVGMLDSTALDFYTLFPKETRAKIEYANFCIRRGEWKKAQEIVAKVVEKEPQNLRAVNTMVRVLLHERKFEQAQQLLGEAELMSPKNASRMVLLGDIYREHGLREQAEAKYNGALEIAPQHREAKQGIAKINLSVGELNAALALLRESSTQEEIASFFNDAAILSVQKRNFPEAYKLYHASLSALEKKGLRSRVLYNVGLAYHKEHKAARAVDFFKKSAAEDPNFVRAQETLIAFGVTPEPASALEKLAAHGPVAAVQGLAVAAHAAAPAGDSSVTPMPISPDAEFAPPVEPSRTIPAESNGVKQVSDEKKMERWAHWEVVVADEGEQAAGKNGTEKGTAEKAANGKEQPTDKPPAKPAEKAKPVLKEEPLFIDDEE